MTKARDLANSAAAFSAVSATELGYVDGVTSAIQTQLDAKAASSTAVTLTGTQTLTNKTLTSPVIASVINNTLTSTTGDIIYASAANTPARLGIGSSAQVLTVASGVPSWATPAGGGGKVLQVVQATTTTNATNTTSTMADTNLTATITPTLNTSKVLVLTNQNMRGYSTTVAYYNFGYQILRGATVVYDMGSAGFGTFAWSSSYSGTTNDNRMYVSGHYLDSPATTSATTYKTQMNSNTTGTVSAQPNSIISSIILMEIGA